MCAPSTAYTHCKTHLCLMEHLLKVPHLLEVIRAGLGIGFGCQVESPGMKELQLSHIHCPVTVNDSVLQPNGLVL